MSHALTAAPPAAWRVLVPGGFVVLWSTGFFIGKLGLAFAPPFTILFLRFALAALLMAAAALPLRSAWPRSPRQAAHLAVVGVLLQTVYLGGCYAAMAAGLPAGITALIVGLQPILIATVVGPLLGERVGPKHWLGLALGFLGVALVLWDKLDIAGLESWGVLFALAGLLGITAATLYQKRFCGAGDLITGTAIQYAAAALTTLPIVLVLGWGPVHWTGSFIFSLAWLTFALSIGAVTLLLWLIRRGVASKVASLFYLTPPAAALGSYLLLNETLAAPALLGMALTAVGVALVNRA
ncbi:MAG TPA: DMT family transporter [Verrucomicrobiae bacterium]|jgi:drug/metabolite transporter (DMT)-like permease|nr:DMT family transporter [Verrucomicrobiae bacterium]